MRRLLNQWAVPPMPANCPSGHMNMPGHGMMSGDEVSALKNAQGVWRQGSVPDADDRAITQGAITMAQN